MAVIELDDDEDNDGRTVDITLEMSTFFQKWGEITKKWLQTLEVEILQI